jgi:hypothetical protein
MGIKIQEIMKSTKRKEGVDRKKKKRLKMLPP